MKKLFNKSKGNPLILALVIPAIVPILCGLSFGVTLAILVLSTFFAIGLNKGLWWGDMLYIIIAYMIVAFAYTFPQFFNVPI